MRPIHLATAILLAAVPLGDAESETGSPAPAYSFADLADLALPAPVVAHVRLRRAVRIPADEAPGIAPGHRRFYVEADTLALIRGRNGLPSQVRYLVDLPDDPRGRAARLPRRSEYILLATHVPSAPDELRLVSHDAQLPYTPDTAARLRDILRQAAAANAPPPINGVGRAFHVPGTLPGESETQIFLQTETGQPISLAVLRRPGVQPRWSVAMSEFVGQSASPPAPDTLLWYRLACTLPSELPENSVADLDYQQAEAARRDYAVIVRELGRCIRRRS